MLKYEAIILDYLNNYPKSRSCDITKAIKIPQSHTTRYLNKLYKSHWVTRERKIGTSEWRYRYWINHEVKRKKTIPQIIKEHGSVYNWWLKKKIFFEEWNI